MMKFAAASSALLSSLAVAAARPVTSLRAKKDEKKGGSKGGKGSDKGSRDRAGEEDDGPELDTEALMNEFEEKMDKSVETCTKGLVMIRAGKASPSLIENIQVETDEGKLAMTELGSITVADASTLTVKLFEDKFAEPVEKALRATKLGFQIAAAGMNLRLTLPPLTTDKRAEYVKMAKEIGEKSKTAIRNVRQDALKKVNGLSKSESENLVQRLKKEVEAMVKKKVDACDKMTKSKEEELNKV